MYALVNVFYLTLLLPRFRLVTVHTLRVSSNNIQLRYCTDPRPCSVVHGPDVKNNPAFTILHKFAFFAAFIYFSFTEITPFLLLCQFHNSLVSHLLPDSHKILDALRLLQILVSHKMSAPYCCCGARQEAPGEFRALSRSV